MVHTLCMSFMRDSAYACRSLPMLQSMREDCDDMLDDSITTHQFGCNYTRDGCSKSKEDAVPDVQGAVDALAKLRVIVSCAPAQSSSDEQRGRCYLSYCVQGALMVEHAALHHRHEVPLSCV